MNAAMLDLVYGEESLYPEFFLELMMHSRSERQGFSHEVASELFYLSEVFEGTRNLPKVFDDNPLAQISNKLDRTGSFEHSPQSFINMRAPSDDSPWASIDANSRFEIEKLGFPCTAAGFLKAAAAKDLKAIGLFLHCNINIDTCDERGWSPLFFESFNGNLELAKLFLEFGANVNLKDNGGFTPLHWAAFNGHDNVIKHLITHNADINARSQRDVTPLMMAAANGHLSACTALIASGAETSPVSSRGWTALQKACLNHHVPVIRLFLSLLKDHVKFLKPTTGIDLPAQPDIV